MSKEIFLKTIEPAIAALQEAVERCKAGEKAEDVFQHYDEWPNASYSICNLVRLKPKKKLRPWTAKEWGIRIGDEFVLNDNRVKLIAVARTTLCFEGASEHFPLPGPQYAARQDDKEITQLDGSPCGEYE